MNELAFEHLPSQAVFIDESILAISRSAMIGIDQGWTMPLGLYEATAGFDALLKEQKLHNTLAIATAEGCDIERVDGPSAGARIHTPDLCLQHIGETHHYRSSSAARFAHLYFKPALLLASVEPQGRLPELRHDRVSFNDPVLAREAKVYLARAFDEGDKPTSLEMDARAAMIAGLLVARHSVDGLKTRPARGGLAPWQLKRACEAMDAHLADDIGLAMLSGIAGCSPTHFSRAFKQSTGAPPFQWLLRRRIERAQILLAAGELALAEVALAVGFSAQAQFTTAFKRVTGATPGAWRRERR